MAGPLDGKIALVAGATRGAGRAIALELAYAGATVYATGRTIDAIDGVAHVVRQDHLDEPGVAALVARIDAAHGRLDILINDIWGGDAITEWGKPFWEVNVAQGFTLIERAIHTHIITSRHAGPLLLRTPDSLVVEVTDGAGFYHRGTLFYDLAKATTIRLAFAMAEELRGKAVTSTVITPGFLRSEAMLEHFGVTEATWRDGIAQDPHFAWSETPRYVGRAIAALAADPDRARWHGRGTSSWQLRHVYGFTDVDGATPDWGAHAATEPFGLDQQASHGRYLAMFD